MKIKIKESLFFNTIIGFGHLAQTIKVFLYLDAYDWPFLLLIDKF